MTQLCKVCKKRPKFPTEAEPPEASGANMCPSCYYLTIDLQNCLAALKGNVDVNWIGCDCSLPACPMCVSYKLIRGIVEYFNAFGVPGTTP